MGFYNHDCCSNCGLLNSDPKEERHGSTSQEKFSQVLGVTLSTVYKWEAGSSSPCFISLRRQEMRQIIGSLCCMLILCGFIGSSAAQPDNGATLTVVGNTTTPSFYKAKKLAVAVFAGHEITLYCGCSYEDKKIDWESCGYKVKSDATGAKRLEWEHVVPAWAFGHSFPEWRDGHPECVTGAGKAFKGRRCAKKVSMEFRLMEADLWNLQPAVGEVNGRRSNYAMALLDGEVREFGACDVEIRDKQIEPRPGIRGNIARTYFYMDAAYPGRGIVSKKKRKLFEAWDMADPVDEFERKRAKRIAAIQGNANPFIL